MSRNVRGFVFEILPRNTSVATRRTYTRHNNNLAYEDTVHVTALFSGSGSRSRLLRDSQIYQARWGRKGAQPEGDYGKQRNAPGKRI
jgi:hypothetical protein